MVSEDVEPRGKNVVYTAASMNEDRSICELISQWSGGVNDLRELDPQK